MTDNFAENLIKGKIVETIFQQMFLESAKYDVYPTGYENSLPSLAHLHHHQDVQNILNQLRKTPDFVIVPKGKDEIYMVEVKYRSELNGSESQHVSEETHSQWEYSWLFLATQHHFYFDSCWKIMNSSGHIDPLPESWIEKGLQDKYLTLLHQFLK